MAANNSEKAKRKNFKWEPDMIKNLIECMINYKAEMYFKNLQFDEDKVMLYRSLRVAMAELYKEELYFGPITVDENDSKECKDLINKGCKRIQEKVKEIRQNFSKALINGSRSGSGKIVYEFYDQLITLWKDSANAKPLSFGVTTEDLNNSSSDIQESEKQQQSSSGSTSSDYLPAPDDILDRDNDIEDTFENFDDINQEDKSRNLMSTPSSDKKRKAENFVPKLIDNKRKFLEKSLSAAQRDQLLIKEAREDAHFRKELAETMRESNLSFSQGIKDMSKSMSDLGAGISRSIEMLSQAMLMQSIPQRPALNQNLFYPNVPPRQSQNTYTNSLLYDYQLPPQGSSSSSSPQFSNQEKKQ